MLSHMRLRLRDTGPVVYRFLRDCQQHAREILHEHSSSNKLINNNCGVGGGGGGGGGARTLFELQLSADRFLAAVDRTIFLPRDAVNEVEDLPMFLIHCIRRHMDSNRALSEEEIVGGFADWLDTSLPHEKEGSNNESRDGEHISFPVLMRLVQSYVRYHRGVRWGERPGAVYRLHPWHCVYCPAAHDEQMPYVHLLQWLMRTKPTTGKKSLLKEEEEEGGEEKEKEKEDARDEKRNGKNEEAMRAWHATESFSPPLGHFGFAALDIGCHSGYMMDLLLKAGARTIIGADATIAPLGNAEATTREHLRERRSHSTGHMSRTIEFIRCDVVPESEAETTITTTTTTTTSTSSTSVPNVPPQRSSSVAGTTSAAAAHRRRAAARLRQIPLNGTATDSGPPPSAPFVSPTATRGPFDLLVFHPPIAPLLPPWPLHTGASHSLPSPHPHSRMTALHELLERLLASGRSPRSDGTMCEKKKKEEGLVRVGGYVAFILPRVLDSRVILQQRLSGNETTNSPLVSLGDVVTATLEGSYTLVLRRRHSLAGMIPIVQEEFTTYLQHFADITCRKHIQRELEMFYHTQQFVDLLVLRKNEITESAVWNHTMTERKNHHHHHHLSSHDTKSMSPTWDSLTYNESFEYTEYIPPSGPPLSHHWTELTPSYSYLDEEYFDSTSAQRNFLATGHTYAAAPVLATETNNGGDGNDGEGRQWGRADLRLMERNAQNYQSLFAAELKKRRGGRMRKMAMQPLERQEWYIDEKLIKSEAAKVDLMNELSRFDLQDWD